MSSILLTAIKYDTQVYPREKYTDSVIDEYADAMIAGAQFPLIILEKDTNILLDGVHRWKAYQKWQELYEADKEKVSLPPTEIGCEFHVVPDGIPKKLYAISLSSRHGLRPKNSEKKNVAKDAYKEKPGIAVKILAQYIGVSEPTAKKYIEDLIAEFDENKRSVIMRLDMLGWTQQEISDKLKELWPDAKGTSRVSVTEFLSENEDLVFSTKKELAKGYTPKLIAQRYNLPEVLTWGIKLGEESDFDKMKELGIKIQPYDHWVFGKCKELFGIEDYPGRIPGQVVVHVLYFFTEPGDMIIDPMAGSGTTPDVCLSLGRECYAYDLANSSERSDILIHDMKRGWPDRAKKADLIFWDPPYFEKKDKEYGEASVSKLGREEYLQFFSERLKEAKGLVKKGTKLAFLMSDWDDNTGERKGIFIWDYAALIQETGWELIRHIQVPLSTQSVHASIAKRFRKEKRLARLERYLLIAKA